MPGNDGGGFENHPRRQTAAPALGVGLTTAAQAQFNSYVDNGTVTIMGYTGPGGDVVIPDTINGLPVTRIREGVFNANELLTSVTIPYSITSIGESALANCTRLTAITVDALNPVYSSLDGVLFDKNQTTLIQCPGGRAETYTIPNGVTSIGEAAFSGCARLTSVTIPNSVTSIGDYAFFGCAGLTSVTIPESVTSIAEYAFSGCTGLTSITLPDSVTSIGGWAFSGCAGLTSVTIGSSVTSIGGGAFYGCTGLTSVTIPNSVTSIGLAFQGCTGLTSVTIPNSVTRIGGWAFEGCTSLTKVTIPNSVTSIGAFAFSGCTGLTSITIPNSVTSIDWRAFDGCSSLTSITIPDSVTSIGLQAFSGCTGLTNVTIGNSVTSIEGRAFIGCTGLTRVTIPYSVKSFDSSAFSSCSNLTSMRFEGNAPSLVGAETFYGTSATVYYNPRTAGWNETFGGLPTVPADQELVFAGLTIRGEVGRVYSIECLAVLGESSESTWRCLEFLQLPASPYWWTDKSALATRKRFYRAVTMEPPANMVFIPPGTFRMGSPTNEEGRWDGEGPQTAVTISRGYWMGKYEVTQGEYEAVMGSNPSWFNGDRTEQGYSDYGTDLSRPVEKVTWDDSTEYCAKLTQRERLAGRIAPNSVYRLPTEAEWEYACRGWTSTRFSYGDDPGYTNLTNYAWYGDNSEGQTHPVGQKLPNPWGLHDMHGNVLEWCRDWWGDYAGGIALDPQGPASGSPRVVRGGFWDYWLDWGLPGDCRSAYRDYSCPESRYSIIGFRVVLAPSHP
ncbi:MAG: formylglycine-generating enzyme family protein [Verrucomicrobia bacterium]|nr:formylglycine-generating enzyme family protein [Verrucomicrobiota bacterium]